MSSSRSEPLSICQTDSPGLTLHIPSLIPPLVSLNSNLFILTWSGLSFDIGSGSIRYSDVTQAFCKTKSTEFILGTPQNHNSCLTSSDETDLGHHFGLYLCLKLLLCIKKRKQFLNWPVLLTTLRIIDSSLVHVKIQPRILLF